MYRENGESMKARIYLAIGFFTRISRFHIMFPRLCCFQEKNQHHEFLIIQENGESMKARIYLAIGFCTNISRFHIIFPRKKSTS